MSKAIKTEHAGAKNGGGYWGKRAVAKHRTKKLRRRVDKLLSISKNKLVGIILGSTLYMSNYFFAS